MAQKKKVEKLPKEYTDLLKEYISFKSVSTDPEYNSEVRKAATWLKSLLKDNGFKVKVVRSGKSNPVLIASFEQPKKKDKKLETILLYGHYDVQPALKSDGWDSDPFVLTEKKNRLIARGAVDNKGQFMVHLYTILKLKREGKLKYNIKFIVEGDEETGSSYLSQIIKENKDLLKADHFLVSDGQIIQNFPTIESSCRGAIGLIVRYTTANTDLHSGLFGSAAPNAAHEMSRLINSFHNLDNALAIKGIYENLDPLPAKQVSIYKKLMKSRNFKDVGIKKLTCEPHTDFLTQVGLRPSLQVCTFKSGYLGEGLSAIVPSRAEIKIAFRTVSPQNNKDVRELIKEHIQKNTPEYVKLEIENYLTIDPVKMDIELSKSKEVQNILKDIFGVEPIPQAIGGSLPILVMYQKIMKKDPISVSLGNEDCNMHGIHENFSIPMIKKGLLFSERFFSR